MSDFDDLDDLFGPLRSDATPAELACERDTVALMAANHASKGTTMFTSRRARVATLIAAGIIGFGGVAAAGSGVSVLLEDEPVDEELEIEEVEEEIDVDEEVEEEIDVEEDIDVEEVIDVEEKVEVVDEGVVEDLAPVVGESTDVEDPDTIFEEATDCKPGNHGATVSAAARGGDATLETYEQREVAQSSCGKTGDVDAAEDEDEIEEEPEEAEEVEEEPEEVDEEVEEVDEEVEQPAAPSRGKSDQAPGRSNGNGKKGD